MDLTPLIPFLSSIGAGGAGIFGSARVVREDERGMIMRFGKVRRRRDGSPKVIRPGFRLIVPAADVLKKIHVRTSTVNLPTQSIMLKDNTVFHVGGMIMVKVKDTPQDIYQVLFETENIRTSVADLCTAELRDLVSGLSYEDMTDPGVLAARAQQHVEDKLSGWGLMVISFKLTDCSPTSETARLVLIGTDATFRAEALRQAAAIVSADPFIRGMDSGLAAALIGTPVASSISSSNSTTTVHNTVSAEEDD